jgi:beta-aspartyl-dipeptidase (metallo-type)
MPSFTLLRNAAVFAPQRLGHHDLLIAAGEIVAMAPKLPDLPAALGAEVVDLEGRRVIPGLIDGHVHLTGGGGEAGPETRVPALQLTALTTGGVTTAIGMLGTDDVVRTTAELVAVTAGLRAEGLSAWCLTGGYHLPPMTLTGSVRGDIALVDEIIGVGEVAISDHRSSQPTLDELLRLAADAHVGGLMGNKAGTVHLHVGDGSRGLELIRQALATTELPPRVWHPTHVNRRKGLLEEAIALTRQGPAIDITAFPVEEGEDAWSAEDALVRCLDAGVPVDRITISSDGGGCLPRFDAEGRVVTMDVGQPDALALALRNLLRAGRSLEQVLPTFTATVAAQHRLSRKGTLRVGGDADLVVLDEDHRVLHVMARGRWHRRDRAPSVLGTFEARSS